MKSRKPPPSGRGEISGPRRTAAIRDDPRRSATSVILVRRGRFCKYRTEATLRSARLSKRLSAPLKTSLGAPRNVARPGLGSPASQVLSSEGQNSHLDG